MNGETSMSLSGRLRRAWVWVILQFALTLLLIVVGVAWTRLPDRHIWQVALTLLVPLLLAISALELQAGTMRKLAEDDGRRVKLVWGAMALLVWIGVAAAAWALLDWCDDRIPLWAGYANSRFSAHARASLLTYQHVQRVMVLMEWLLRWLAVPAVLIPFGVASSQWGWRVPLGRVVRLLFKMRWWVGVALAALAGVWLPSHFFDKAPGGSVHAQVLSVGIKLGGAYLLAVSCWVMLLAWGATLSGEDGASQADDAGEPELAPVGRNDRPRIDAGEIVPPEDDLPA